MPRSTVNLLLAVAAAAAGLPLYFLIGAFSDHSLFRLDGDFPWPVLIGMTAAAIVGACWAVIFRASIAWTPRRAALSAAAFVGVWMLTAAAEYIARETARRDEINMFMPLAGLAASLAAVALTWRETRTERHARLAARTIPCPTCGYNLAGLKQTACPECGSQFRLEHFAGPRSADPDV